MRYVALVMVCCLAFPAALLGQASPHIQPAGVSRPPPTARVHPPVVSRVVTWQAPDSAPSRAKRVRRGAIIGGVIGGALGLYAGTQWGTGCTTDDCNPKTHRRNFVIGWTLTGIVVGGTIGGVVGLVGSKP